MSEEWKRNKYLHVAQADRDSARAEVKRLEAEVERLRAAMAEMVHIDTLHEVTREVERLRFQADHMENVRRNLIAEVERLRAERDHLKEAFQNRAIQVERLREQHGYAQEHIGTLLEEVKRLRLEEDALRVRTQEEVERLRAALDQARDYLRRGRPDYAVGVLNTATKSGTGGSE